MESLDFPDNPGLNETWPAPNGITYQWDGKKWDVFVRPDDNVNYWARNAATEKLSPRNFDESLHGLRAFERSHEQARVGTPRPWDSHRAVRLHRPSRPHRIPRWPLHTCFIRLPD